MLHHDSVFSVFENLGEILVPLDRVHRQLTKIGRTFCGINTDYQALKNINSTIILICVAC